MSQKRNKICSIVHTAIDVMERDGIFQWDALYPTKEDFYEDVDESQLYVGLMNGQIAVVYALNQKCDKEYDKEYENGKWKYKDEPFYTVHRLCVNPTFQNSCYSEVGHADWRKGRFFLMEKSF